MVTELFDCFATKPLQGGNADYRAQYTKHDTCLGAVDETVAGRDYATIQTAGLSRHAAGSFTALVKIDVRSAAVGPEHAASLSAALRRLKARSGLHWLRWVPKTIPRSDSSTWRFTGA